ENNRIVISANFNYPLTLGFLRFFSLSTTFILGFLFAFINCTGVSKSRNQSVIRVYRWSYNRG
ncbi:MAG: hypothetical protein WAM42_15570, partial [Candidatus Nitrosopolaris sp.]